jgi:hypothetical protein
MRVAGQLAASFRVTGLLILALSFGGCSGGQQAGSDAPVSTSATGTTVNSSSPSGSTSAAIALHGVPPISATVGSDYAFQPTVSAGSGAVTYKVAGLPAWLGFDANTGAVSGVPAAKDQGTTGHITISASNGSSSASMTPFTIQVQATGSQSGPTGSVKLSWSAPTQNTDGSEASDLAGYHIFYGTSADQLNKSIDVVGGTSTTYVVAGLSAGTYYFSVLAYNSGGSASGQSNITNQTI